MTDPHDPYRDCFSDPPEGKPIPRYWGFVDPPSVSVRSSIYLSICLSIYLSIYLAINSPFHTPLLAAAQAVFRAGSP